MSARAGRFVSRAGEKLDAALEGFGLDPNARVCADFGCNVGGFTDCLLRRGAAKVFAVDTAYGALAWRLRNDPRVVVLERTNALYAEPPSGGVDLVVIDVAFTPQRLIVPAAARWLRPGGDIVSLLKPRYELDKQPGGRQRGRRRAIGLDLAREICLRTCQALVKMDLGPLAILVSPLAGKGGNAEFLLHVRPERPAGTPTRGPVFFSSLTPPGSALTIQGPQFRRQSD